MDLERGARPRDVLCLHQMETSGVFAPVPRQLGQLQLPYCWVHRVQFLWGPCEVPELWQGASLLPGLEMSPEDQDSVVVKESVLMLNIPQQVPSPSKGLLQAGLGAHLVLQLAELWD